jgi:UDP-glucose:glycoprotein glucosyltransferase
LDKIADGHFDTATTDEALYTKFRSLLLGDGHLGKDALSAFDYALSIHSAAPRIEAHYQFYNTSVAPSIPDDKQELCSSWAHIPFTGQRFCSPDLSEESAKKLGKLEEPVRELPFDRVLGDSHSERPAILYTDITSASFRTFHKTFSKTAKEGKTSYRVRYRAPSKAEDRPLAVSGYGVELALKRTDYIVIDDRATEETAKETAAGEVKLNEEEVADLRPLSTSEVKELSMKAASFIMSSDDPFETLLRLTMDFPKHTSSIASAEISEEFVQEHKANRKLLIPPGYNVVWINGVQVVQRDFEAYSLLESLRHERKLISGLQALGLTGPEAIELLSHPAITLSQIGKEVQRFDWRDEVEGGNVIIWLNDLEKDKRYADWPSSIRALFQRTYPGQLPSVRRDIHNVVIPIDFSDSTDVELAVETLQNFVKRKIPIRFGIVPKTHTVASKEQAKVVRYLTDGYGLAASLHYLETHLKATSHKTYVPEAKALQAAIQDRKLRVGRTVLALEEILKDTELESQIEAASAYARRFGSLESPPVLTNGVPIAYTENWMQAMSQQVGQDFQELQQSIMSGGYDDDFSVPQIFLANAQLRRNAYIVPEDEKEIRHINLGDFPEIASLPTMRSNPVPRDRGMVHIILAANVDSVAGFEQLMDAILFLEAHDNVELAVLHVPGVADDISRSKALFSRSYLSDLRDEYGHHAAKFGATNGVDTPIDDVARHSIYQELRSLDTSEHLINAAERAPLGWKPFSKLVSQLKISPGQRMILVNGRIVGPIPEDAQFVSDDFETLLTYEKKKRLTPTADAIEERDLKAKASTALDFARFSNLLALSMVSDVPEGFFEAAPTVRNAAFNKWESKHTSIHIGDRETATIQIVVSLDPATETAQRWVPILKVLSEMEGVHVALYLNPRDVLSELPVKRFYRHVLSSKPEFEADGSLKTIQAKFEGLPSDALLNIGMDLPPSWLVAPKVTVHDLDNIKLSAVKGAANIEAIYELEHILIEGHSREAGGQAPRGVQLVLGTDRDAHVADTIIMANLGYFQFKANPGIYDLKLQPGRSADIFAIDSAGSLGYGVHPGDNTTEIALMSFRGVTLYPRLSRKPGTESEDVLELSKTTFENLADGAEQLLNQAGLPDASKYLAKAAKFGAGLLPGGGKAASGHADINIFSVASGHLYERMLNIMMLSVIKHTKHSVKFWFIEQFLSPSFKDFLPFLASEYGFQYEMVTYKWPHWLRGQKEKQREIWGYKILFLDVLFPLDLDKVIFVDADQIVRTDMYELVQHDLHGAPYGFTPMCDSRVEMEGFRFWKQGYWKNFLQGLPYHISALYVVDLKEFRRIAAGDRLRQNYHALSADPNSLSNLDQDLPNHMQSMLPIHSLPQEWLWCETWCSDESLKDAKTIDLCNNPQTKEPKLDRARRQVPEWTVYDDEIAEVAQRHKHKLISSANASNAGGLPNVVGGRGGAGESVQEVLQREDAKREELAKKAALEPHKHDEL